MNILFSQQAWEEYVSWQREDKKIAARINALIKDIRRSGMLKGMGQPERLKYGFSGLCSRRINKEHRLIYAKDSSDNLVIVKCRGHYE